MSAPLWAGFEGALLHWNGHDTLLQTRHTPEQDMARHYADAINAGAVGFRDALPERFDPAERIATAHRVAGDRPIVWSLSHWDRPVDPLGHAHRVAGLIGPHDRLIAVVEPSVGPHVSGMSPKQSVALAGAMMAAVLSANPVTRFWLCDPLHHAHDAGYEATDALVAVFGDRIEAVGVNHHALYSGDPLAHVLRVTAGRYPHQRVALTETSLHDQHPDQSASFDGWSRPDWWRHVQCEIAASGVDVLAACWMPWLDMAFEPGEVWPNGWKA